MSDKAFNGLLAGCLLLVAGCQSSTTASIDSSDDEDGAATTEVELSLQDPSLKKCIDDGHELLPIEDEGVVRSYLCVNTASAMKCDSWAYFRGECDLNN